nr:LuxR family transcriptional regulator [Azospirillum sp. B510]
MDYFDDFKRSKDKSHFLSRIIDSVGPFNVTYFGTQCTSSPDRHVNLLTTYSEKWRMRYFDRRYENIDPVLSAARRATMPVDWDQLPKTDSGVEDFIADALCYGIRLQGVTFSLRDMHQRLAIVSLQSNDDPAVWRVRRPRIIPDFIHFSLALHSAMVSSEPDDAEEVPCKLSPREREVLDWASRGKTSWETGMVLGLSEKTVNFYLRNACQKMNAATKVQAAAQAVREGLI